MFFEPRSRVSLLKERQDQMWFNILAKTVSFLLAESPVSRTEPTTQWVPNKDILSGQLQDHGPCCKSDLVRLSVSKCLLDQAFPLPEGGEKADPLATPALTPHPQSRPGLEKEGRLHAPVFSVSHLQPGWSRI